ncbi:hypothetical protein ACN469_16300 [Corallococcus terminator]
MLCPMRMNRLALLFCFVSLLASAQPVPDAGVSDSASTVGATPTPSPAAPATAPSQEEPGLPLPLPPRMRTAPSEAEREEEARDRVRTESRDERSKRWRDAEDEDSRAEDRDERASAERAEDEEDARGAARTESRNERASDRRERRREKEKRAACDEDYLDDEVEELAALHPLELNVDGRTLTPELVELHGLKRLTEDQVRAFIGSPPPEPRAPLPTRDLQRMLRRLAHTGLFARVEPRLRVPEQGPVVLEVHLEENPVVTSVEVEGLQDLQRSEILDEVFRLPPRFPDEDEDDEEFTATLRVNGARGTLTVTRPCPPQRPPREWLARMERDEYRPGLVLGGVTSSLQRALRDLRGDGYMLASLSGTLTPKGHLTIIVDEGRLEGVDVVGVDGPISDRVRAALDLKAGDVFLRSDARRAMERLESRLPFLQAASVDTDSDDARRRRDARIVEERAADGVRHYRTEEQQRKKRRREQVELELSWREMFESWRHGHDGEGITLEGRRLVVHVRPRRPDLDLELLPVHTQVTGFAPGLAGSLRIWDAKDRLHTTLDAAAFIPLRWGGQRLPDDPEGTKRQRELNLLGGARVEIPAVGLAELGGQAYDFTDTLDRWRMSDIDSSIYSALLNRPDRDYFRRKGVAAFATFRWSEDWLTGVEYRSDRYETLRSFTPPLSLFRRDSPPFPNAPVDEGRFQSVIARLEYASGTPRDAKVGSLFRTPETPLFHGDGDWGHSPFLHGFITLEVGEGPAATGPDERFWKLLGDVTMVVPTGWETGLRLRLRGAGGDNLPEQKREALGGWSALRGFGFKEFKGDVSVLGTAEYRWHAFGLFADLGTVRGAGEWQDARLGVGGTFHFTDDVRVDVAWRTDEKATATPEARLFFVRTF